MKLNVISYLIKDGVTESEALDFDKAPQKISLNINDVQCSLYLKKSHSKPKWSDIFSGVNGVNESIFYTESVKGLLIVKVYGRLLAFTFGHGRSMIKPYMVERGFGLRVALNLGDSERIKSIDKSTLEKVSLNTRSQTSRNTNVNDFDFEFDQEILKSISAIVEDSESDESEIISGCDSVSIYTNIELDQFPDLAKRLLTSYNDKKYQEKYPWVDFIQAITDQTVQSILNEKMLDKINSEQFDDVWISPPEIINYDDFSGFIYKFKKGCCQCFHSELDLEVYIAEAKIKKPVNIESLKRKEIRIFNSNEQDIGGWPIYQCMNSEVVYENETYILNDGRWYRVDSEFSNAVNSFFNSLNNCNIKFPPYKGMHEGSYLRAIADGENFALLDQQWIYPKGTGNKIEFCDLLSQCNAFIHVKKYGSSSVLSHLFSQASVATDFLMNDPSVQEQVNNYLDETYLSVNFNSDESPRKYRIVLAIMQKSPGDLHLPFFSKVNLRHHGRRLINMGFKVELAKIYLS
ncbi:TIGR04141 family sporadically distributed protein [Shewanella xiamenensis]|uniref:TIGR04141 family sporadically distributed protein n=1 Tax=Shewanella xiamenensis TaxID=332186 RepID=UPI0024A62E63|nr:TIGR04141 family sporadically distributed protein [Shewanella xiamenensis]MDI5838357.1 TIGR04141 family sporadically distributed protein [Shewanella xiamenensis]MDI5841383.1 TIGR04141 family sporadically distributed protein [Shewanella xiamenensis]MDI5844991.1 TIGR04141 family sporadically distributed protein [Shewanella xiamenensis]MDI5849875.1 TIGR04141 family sporadically distributed protein [Shewanella xiamenensis]MDI5853074.1 TIGR04141 family sporadically distributed protein [Shewanell